MTIGRLRSKVRTQEALALAKDRALDELNAIVNDAGGFAKLSPDNMSRVELLAVLISGQKISFQLYPQEQLDLAKSLLMFDRAEDL